MVHKGSVAVLICDGRLTRRQRLERLVQTSTVPVDVVRTQLDELDASPSLALALVAVDAGELRRPGAPTDEALAIVNLLRRRSVPVICYGDGSDAWPLAARCRVLLAGAPGLLDSSSASFEPRLGVELLTRAGAAAEEGAVRQRLSAVVDELGIVGQGAALRSVLRAVERSSRLSDMPVLLLGETGTGKELLARAVHLLDLRRRKHPFVALNCAALTKTLAEAHLFGHRKGVFSGADRERIGLLRAASGGVLFLDEIGELDLELQSKLLRVIQERRVLVLGDAHETDVDIRIVAATHRDLNEMVRDQRFRADLLSRLWVYPIEVPPLRSRREDLPALVDFFLRKHGGAEGGAVAVEPEFLEALQSVRLAGNVRQLENIIQRAIVMMAGDERPIGLADLPPELLGELADLEPSVPAKRVANPDSGDAVAELNLFRALARHERRLIETALRESAGNQTRAATLLGITARSLYTKLRKHRLVRRDAAPP